MFHVLLRTSLVLLVAGVLWTLASRAMRRAPRPTNQSASLVGASEAFDLVGASLRILQQNPRLLWIFLIPFAGFDHASVQLYLQFLAKGSDEQLHNLLQFRVVDAGVQFASLWIQLLLTLGVLAIAHRRPFRLGVVLRQARDRWRSILFFAAIDVGGSICFGALGGLYENLISLKHQHRFAMSGLLAGLWRFSLALGLPVLANESHEGLGNIRRAWSLMGRVWFALLLAAPAFFFVPLTAFWVLELAVKPILPQPGALKGFTWIAMAPFSVLSQVFETCLYLRLHSPSAYTPIEVLPGERLDSGQGEEST